MRVGSGKAQVGALDWQGELMPLLIVARFLKNELCFTLFNSTDEKVKVRGGENCLGDAVGV